MNGGERVVRLADIEVGAAGDTLVALGLGSCVAVIIHDPEGRVGGLAHVMLPAAGGGRPDNRPGATAETAVPALVARAMEAGADPRRLVARIAGGASMFVNQMVPGTIQVGERNVLASRRALARAGIPLVGQAVGGSHGRSVRYEVATGRVTVHTVAHGTSEL